MTNDEIVCTIAEFMGWTQVDTYVEVPGQGRGIDPDGHESHLPRFMSSHDALAPVWRKLFESSNRNHMHNKDEDCVFCLAHDGLVENAAESLVDAIWFTNTPSQHAEALARAIQESKEGATNGA